MHKLFPLSLLAVLVVSTGCGKTYYPDPKPEAEEVSKIQQALTKSSAPADTSTDSAAVGTGWATLKGKITLSAAAGAGKALNCNKDEGVCCVEKPLDNSLVTGPGNGLANVYVYLRSKKMPRIHESYDALKGTEVVLDNDKCMFKPHCSAVWLQQKLVVQNTDNAGHNTNYGGSSAFNIGLPPAAGGKPYRDDKVVLKKADKKPAAVGCNVHPWMLGYVMALEHPYFAITNDKGEFTIKNLPAGEALEIVVWHERNPKLSADVDGLKLKDGVLPLKLAENEEKALNLTFELDKFPGQ
jgi:hypothetical protein